MKQTYCRACGCPIRIYSTPTADGPYCTVACACYQITGRDLPSVEAIEGNGDTTDTWADFIAVLAARPLEHSAQ